ncbi:MAG: von Willebrand factor type A domain-containing protein, partial [Akkermansiaceae bacterium]|nr:von Willebrand factor type A domain-containing protein [Akkermansiaceae bacterium]
VFKRRIESVHGMVQEGYGHRDNPQWKLSSKKRVAIEELIGQDEAAADDRAREARIGASGRRQILAIAACLVLTLVVATLTWPIFFNRAKMDQPEAETIAYAYESPASNAVGFTLDAGSESYRFKNGKKEEMVPLSGLAGELPAELIEGTPKPMNVPGLVDPSQQSHMKALAEPSSRRGEMAEIEQKTPQNTSMRPSSAHRKPREVALSAPHSARRGGDGESMAVVEESLGRSIPAKKGGNMPLDSQKRPSPPSASVSRAITSTGVADMAVPEGVELETAANDFGSRGDFGTGWGSGGATGGVPSSDSRSRGKEALEAKLKQQTEAGQGQQGPAAGVDPFAPAEGRRSSDTSLAESKLGADYKSQAGERSEYLFRGMEYDALESKDVDEDGLSDKEVYTYWYADESGKDQALNDHSIRGGVSVEALEDQDADSLGSMSDVQSGGLKRDLSTLLDMDLSTDGDQPQSDNLSGLAKREMIRRHNDAAMSDKLAMDAEQALKDGNFELANERYEEALSQIPNAPMFQDRIDKLEAELKELEELKEKAKEEPRKRPVVTDEETVAAQDPYSTFSLNINDASFRVAQAALAKGEMPDPNAIKVEQFYNAVDYGDPSPAAGQPVTSQIEQTAHPVIPGRNLVRIAIKTASEGRNEGQPLRLTLLIDQSGSMAREDRRDAMLEALEGLRGLLKENDQVNVIGFARTPRLIAEGIPGNQGQLEKLVNIEANEGGTNLEEAIKLGQQLAERNQLEGAQNRMVLLTDGAANLGDADPDSLAKKIENLRQKGIAFDIAGIVADGLNDELLSEMARHGNGRYYVVGKGESDRFAEQLAGAFRPAAENVKVQVHFNPERVGRYKLIGFEKDRLNKEDFRNDAVDAAEMAAEEAGVAIYQVETLPDGEGEIGEVSVRFRDVASGEMVERSWTIINEMDTPALDQARPSMQLATLSMMAAQKLKGGPLADAINFNDLGEVIAQVQQHFKGDPRAAEMLEMINQLK